VRELALNAQCISVDEASTHWQLRLESETLRAASHCGKLEAAMSAHIGRPVRLQVEAGPAQDTPALRLLVDLQDQQRKAEKIIHDDPWVCSMLARYTTARIVPGSIQPRFTSGEPS
jgi:DNA polymerase-3 subunit gamma/tau